MIEGSPAKKDLGTLVDEKQNHPAMCSCSQKAKHLLGCITSSMVSRTREVIVPSVCSCETLLDAAPSLGPPARKDFGLSEWIQSRPRRSSEG